MKDQNELNIKRYLKKVSSELTCSFTIKRLFIKDLKRDITEFSKSNDISEEVLYREFGKPEEIAFAFFDREDYSQLIKKAKKQAIVSTLITFIIIIALILSIAVIHELYELLGGNVTVIIE